MCEGPRQTAPVTYRIRVSYHYLMHKIGECDCLTAQEFANTDVVVRVLISAQCYSIKWLTHGAGLSLQVANHLATNHGLA